MRMQTWQRQDAVGAVGGRQRSVGVSALVGLVIGLGLTPSGWATTYTFSSIDFDASGTTVATGINNNGQIVGSYEANGTAHGFLHSGAAIVNQAWGRILNYAWLNEGKFGLVFRHIALSLSKGISRRYSLHPFPYAQRGIPTSSFTFLLRVVLNEGFRYSRAIPLDEIAGRHSPTTIRW